VEGKYVVAAVGIGGVAAVEIVNIIHVGVDSTVLSTVVGAITFIVGLAFGHVAK